MTPAVLWPVLLLVATGVPLLALPADRAAARRDARRGPLPLPPAPDDSWAFRRRHRLSVEDMQVVDRALRTGERVEDPRLRGLTVERATALLAQARHRARPGRRTWAALAVLAVALVVVLVEVPPHNAVPLVGVVNLPVQLALAVHQRRRLQLALDHNGASAP